MTQADYFAAVLIKAEQEQAQSEFEQFFEKYIAYIRSKGYTKMLPMIFAKVSQRLEDQAGSNKTTLTVANSDQLEEIKALAQNYSDVFGEEYSVVEDSNIVGGFVLKNNTNLVDASYKSRLLEMYQDMVA